MPPHSLSAPLIALASKWLQPGSALLLSTLIMAAAAPPMTASSSEEQTPVYTDLERGAARQQAQDVISLYDFRIYGEGLVAGPFTSPVPDTTVVFAPTAAAADTPSRSPGAATATTPGADTPPLAAPAATQQPPQVPWSKRDSSGMRSDQRLGDPDRMQTPHQQEVPPTASAALPGAAAGPKGSPPASSAALPGAAAGPRVSAHTNPISSSTPRTIGDGHPSPATTTTTTTTTTSSSSSTFSAAPHTQGPLRWTQAGALRVHPPPHPPTTAAAPQQPRLHLRRGVLVSSPAAATAAVTQDLHTGGGTPSGSSSSRSCTATPGPWYRPRPQALLHKVVFGPKAALHRAWQQLVTLLTSIWQMLVTLVTSIRSGAWRLVRSVLELMGLSLLLLLGLVFGPWYQHNRSSKSSSAAALAQGLDRPFDAAAVTAALGALPSWLEGAAAGQLDRLNWLNDFIAEVWPVLDPYACGLMRATIEPLLDQYKPPFIAKMGFQRLTLGDAPFQVEAVRLLGDAAGSARHTAGHSRRKKPHTQQGAQGPAAAGAAAEAPAGADRDAGGPGGAAALEEGGSDAGGSDLSLDQQLPSNARERVEFEVDFTWAGEPNIAFFVEMALLGPHSRLVPRVSNSTVKGTLRLSLTPLVPVVPGFGALLVSLTHTPQVRFTLDFGPALGGKFTAAPVATFLDPFIRDTLANLLVWPQRVVVPLLGEEVTGNLDQLNLRSRGVLQVEVLRCEGLVKRGVFHTLDPRVELWTQTGLKVTTGTKARTRHPRWHKETFQLLVQEPASQVLRAVVQDMEMFNLKELVQINVLKGARNLLSNAVPIGRATLPLAQVCAKPEERQEVWLPLSGDEWEEDLGVSAGGRGRLQLGLTYHPFREDAADAAAPVACRGVLFVDVRRCRDLVSGDWQAHSSDPYVDIQVGNQTQRTAVVQQSLNPVYNTHHEFFNIQTHDVIRIRVRDQDFLKPDDFLGQVVVPVKDLVAWVAPGGRRGVQEGWWQLGSVEQGAIQLALEYKAYSG